MKATLWKSKERTKYALSDFYVKADQESNLIIINSKLIKKLGLKVKSTNTLTNQYLSMFIRNGDFIELKNWIKFWVKVIEIQQEMWAFVRSKKSQTSTFC